jgi:hypothetical protein
VRIFRILRISRAIVKLPDADVRGGVRLGHNRRTLPGDAPSAIIGRLMGLAPGTRLGPYEIAVQISSGGGAQPRWTPDGKELLYVAFDEQLMAASITPAADGRSVTSGTPVPLFRTRLGGAIQGALEQLYVVAPDGRRFLMATLPEDLPRHQSRSFSTGRTSD